MPAGDGTGPEGMGPMMGHRAGCCSERDEPGYATMPRRGSSNVGWGHGRWFRQGRGRSDRRRRYMAPPTPEQETSFLKTQAEWLKVQLDAIGQRITELEQEE
ncbi:MAG: DUF5320 domain-containing protein [Chloroflexi bacterium]|nr:DUF5320 domain-containing protein [Chloroflexota bacterium]